MKLKIILKAVLFRLTAVVLGLLVAAVVGEVAIRLTMPSRLSRQIRNILSLPIRSTIGMGAAREHYGLSQIQR